MEDFMYEEQAQQVLQVFVDFSVESYKQDYVSSDLLGIMYEIEDLYFEEFNVNYDDEIFLDIKKLAEAALNTLKN
jgi:hypothetical protein